MSKFISTFAALTILASLAGAQTTGSAHAAKNTAHDILRTTRALEAANKSKGRSPASMPAKSETSDKLEKPTQARPVR